MRRQHQRIGARSATYEKVSIVNGPQAKDLLFFFVHLVRIRLDSVETVFVIDKAAHAA